MNVAVTPGTASVRAGTTQQFTALVTGTTDTAVTWTASAGTISSSGLYTAPPTLASSANVTITAIAHVDGKTSGTAQVALQNPMPVVTLLSPAVLAVGNFTLTITGTGFVNGATTNFNGRALSTTFVSATQLTASGSASTSDAGTAAVAVTNPVPGTATSAAMMVPVNLNSGLVTYDAAVRFLEQSTWGPTPSLIAHVQLVGYDAFLNEQFAVASSTYVDPPPTQNNLTPTQQQFFANALTGQDQLRQRTAFALEQIIVISGLKIRDPLGMTNWLRMMQADAFGTYATLLKDVTLSPAMGRYLDMVNNDKPNPTAGVNPNENYAREVMQLFSIGVNQLNPDGTPQRDASGNLINSYDQDVVEGFAHLFTGWTYPTKPGSALQRHNPEYYGGPMELYQPNHDADPKLVLSGVVLPANQPGSKDLDDGLATLANHPNLGPFICKQLIQHLVKSNPTAAYVQRVATVFSNNGQGVRGDLKAVVRAILLDQEARAADTTTPSASAGHLREPALYLVAVLRALNAASDGMALIGQSSQMSQNVLFPASVFNFFSPDYMIPSTNLIGPEFEIQNPGTATVRVNFVNQLVFGGGFTGTRVDFSNWAGQAATPDTLINSLNHLFLHGQMSAGFKSTLLTAMAAAADNNTKARQAIYLVVTSPEYMVQQ
jgi:uncharacterized protein (DUF1800 family)